MKYLVLVSLLSVSCASFANCNKASMQAPIIDENLYTNINALYTKQIEVKHFVSATETYLSCIVKSRANGPALDMKLDYHNRVLTRVANEYNKQLLKYKKHSTSNIAS